MQWDSLCPYSAFLHANIQCDILCRILRLQLRICALKFCSHVFSLYYKEIEVSYHIFFCWSDISMCSQKYRRNDFTYDSSHTLQHHVKSSLLFERHLGVDKILLILLSILYNHILDIMYINIQCKNGKELCVIYAGKHWNAWNTESHEGVCRVVLVCSTPQNSSQATGTMVAMSLIQGSRDTPGAKSVWCSQQPAGRSMGTKTHLSLFFSCKFRKIKL